MSGTVYGDKYRNLLTNRLLKSTYYDGRDLKLNWGDPIKTEVGILVSWKDVNGNLKTTEVDPEETETWLPYFDLKTPVTYSSTHLPDSLAIDVFQANANQRMVDPVTFIPKTTWVAKPLPGDMGMNGSFPRYLLGTEYQQLHAPVDPDPSRYLTWDMGIKAKLSRMTIWPRRTMTTGGHGDSQGYLKSGSLDPKPNGSLTTAGRPGQIVCVQLSGNG